MSIGFKTISMGIALWTMPFIAPAQDKAQAAPQLGIDPIDDVIAAMTVDEKVNLIVGFGSTFTSNYSAAIGNSGDLVPGAAGQSNGIPRLGIPTTVLADGPAGLRINSTRPDDPNTYYCTHFPIGTLLACTWDTALVRQVGAAMGNEVLEYGCDVLLAPATNIHRNPLCGRNFEYYSEDPLVSGEIAAAMIQGLQSQGIGTSLKHFALNNQETNRTGNNSIVSPRTAREIYLKPFEIAVKKAQPWTIMSSYNLINGTYAAQRSDLLTDLLRHEWGFEGMVMSDWYGGRNPIEMVLAGNDMIQPGHSTQVAAITNAINQGTLPMDIVNRNVAKILEYVMKTPRFRGYVPTNAPDLGAHAATTRQAAAQGMVLLKNNKKTLPLKAGARVALFGTTSYDIIPGGTGSGDVNSAYTVSLDQGLSDCGFSLSEKLSQSYQDYAAAEKAKLPEKDWFSTRHLIPEMPITPAQAAAYATANNLAIITIGKSAGEGSDRYHDEYYLTDAEQSLIQTVTSAFHKQGKRAVVVLNIPGVIETASWRVQPDAILLAWMGGQETGYAIADVLSGAVNPSGKLTMTFPMDYADVPSAKYYIQPDLYTGDDHNAFVRHQPVDTVGRGTGAYESIYGEGIFVGYRAYDTDGTEVAYPFGYGLSYTTFDYKDPSVSTDAEQITLTFTIKNTGRVAGREVAQAYVHAPGQDMPKPQHELRGFAKTRLLQPGESERLTIQIPLASLASYDESTSSWSLEPLPHTLESGG
ncbi:MAG: glycoside hydrolase family 3 C-terminal domain-containing protein [Bacteroidales bacterium]|nr:glycoside hydrolase family 3 C-terminal domain-containing protein [Bacteroidales bacterium]